MPKNMRAMRSEGVRLRPRLRALFYAVFAVLFASGAGWWILHTWMARSSEFGSEPNPMEPWFLKVHGAVAMIALVLLGVLYPVHIKRGWHARHNRTSGLGVIVVCLVLIATGYLLYYAGGETARAVASCTHLWLGLALPAIIAVHIWRGRTTRRERGRPILRK